MNNMILSFLLLSQLLPAAAAQVAQRAKCCGILIANGQDLTKLVVRDRNGETRLPCRAVFDSAEADVEVAASGGRIEAGETHLQEPWSSPKAFGK